MPRKADPTLHRISVMVNREDYTRLQELYAIQGVSVVIRALMRAHLLKIDRKASAMEHLLPEIEIPLGDLNV